MNWLKNATLIDMVARYALEYGDFTLSSGQKSDYFVDMSKITNRSDCLDIITQSILHYLEHEKPCQAIGGPVLGAAPIIGGFLAAYQRHYYGVGLMRGFLVRKEEKNGELIEGLLCPGDNVLIVEDVVTTGTQTKRAVEIVESEGGKVCGIIAILDRLGGAQELLGERFRSMMTIEDVKAAKSSQF